MITAVITWLHPTKGFGFCSNPDGKWFLHTSNVVEGSITLGALIQFELADAVTLGKPKQAIKIRVLCARETGLGGDV